MLRFRLLSDTVSAQRPHLAAKLDCIATRNSSKDITWRSIYRDADTKLKPISLSDAYERTKLLHNSDAEWSELEQSVITMAEDHRKRWPLGVAKSISHLKSLPYGLADTPSIGSLIDIYIDCYDTVREMGPVHCSAGQPMSRLMHIHWTRRALDSPLSLHFTFPSLCLVRPQTATPISNQSATFWFVASWPFPKYAMDYCRNRLKPTAHFPF